MAAFQGRRTQNRDQPPQDLLKATMVPPLRGDIAHRRPNLPLPDEFLVSGLGFRGVRDCSSTEDICQCVYSCKIHYRHSCCESFRLPRLLGPLFEEGASWHGIPAFDAA